MASKKERSEKSEKLDIPKMPVEKMKVPKLKDSIRKRNQALKDIWDFGQGN